MTKTERAVLSSKGADIKDFFRSLPASSRHLRKEAYEHLISVEKGEIYVKHAKMPWMLPAWERGLAVLNEVISELDSQNNAENANNHTQNANNVALNVN
jgi:hypothetical protein